MHDSCFAEDVELEEAVDAPGTSNRQEPPVQDDADVLRQQLLRESQKTPSTIAPLNVQTIAEIAALVSDNIIKKRESDLLDKTSELLQRSRKDDVFFKNKSIKAQFKSTTELKEIVNKALAQLERKETEKAAESLEIGKKLILDRLKILRIADKFGWSVVKRYRLDDIVDDAADEKKLKEAIKEFRAEKSDKNDNYRNRYRDNRSYSPYRDDSRSKRGNRRGGRQVPRCYKCNKLGHKVPDCYMNRKSGSYPNKK